MEDCEIIKLYFDRSDRAITETDRKYGKICMKTACGITGSPEDAEECVNDTYLCVWNAVPPDRPAVLRAYLIKIVRNLSINRLKHNGRLKRGSAYYECAEELSFSLCSGDSTEGEFDRRLLCELIEKFVTGLKETDRMLFIRRYFYTDTYESLSEITGIKENALRTRLSRVRKKLKEYLIKEGVRL